MHLFLKKSHIKTKLSPDEILKLISSHTINESERNTQLISFKTFVGTVNYTKQKFKIYHNEYTMNSHSRQSAKILLKGKIKREKTHSIIDITIMPDWLGIIAFVLLSLFFFAICSLLFDGKMIGFVLFMLVIIALAFWAVIHSCAKKGKEIVGSLEFVLEHRLTINVDKKKTS